MPARHYVYFQIVLFLFVVLNAPNLALSAISPSSQQLFAKVFVPSVFWGLMLYAIVPRVSIYLFCLFVPLALMEMLYVLRYERVTDEHVFAIIQETNIQEAISWLGPGGWVTLAVGVLTTIACALVIRLHGTSQPNLPTRWRAILILAGVVVFAMLRAPDLADLESVSAENHMLISPAQATGTQQISTQLIGEFDRSSLNDSFPWGLPFRINRYVALQEGMRNARHALIDFRFDAVQASSRTSDDEIFLLIIGETGRPDRWQLNGYGRPTNPRLSNQEGVVSFTNAISGWAWTRMSVPIIVSRKPSSINNSFFPERSIISAFREANFWTAWYSMHGALGFHESAVALYANEANDVRYINPAGYRSPGAYDAALLAPLNEALIRPERKKFIVLHTMGSHYNYAHRVPPEFEIFQPSLRGRRDSDLHDRKQREQLNNSYDNSIRYTDHVLAEIIQRLTATGRVASLLYVADHGENLFDGDCDKSGHGHNTEHDFRIAAAWWNSTEFARRYPEKVAAIAARREAPWSTENIFNTLLDAAGISIAGQTASPQSLFHPKFVPQPRWIQSGVHFDTAVREGVCGFLKPVNKPNENKVLPKKND
jgi:glucan phosphoethanolaminetransferase (alkaline phosphatase superfamily)